MREPQAKITPLRAGDVRWSPVRSCWLIATYFGAAYGAAPTFSCGSLCIFMVSSVVFLCLGFSVGLHRGVIHGSFKTHKWLEVLFMLLATLNGFGGLVSLARMHQLRDYWQNHIGCPEYFAYRHGPLRDYLWYLHMDYRGSGRFEPPLCSKLLRDPCYGFLERAWLPLQLGFAGVLCVLGGWSYLVWGVCVRVSVCLTGVWFVNYVCHKHGYRNFRIAGSIEEGRNNLLLGVISMGEGWHNNHHAHPGSAQIGIAWWEVDPGFACIRLLERLGVVWDVQTVGNTRPREPSPDLHVPALPPSSSVPAESDRNPSSPAVAEATRDADGSSVAAEAGERRPRGFA